LKASVVPVGAGHVVGSSLVPRIIERVKGDAIRHGMRRKNGGKKVEGIVLQGDIAVL